MKNTRKNKRTSEFGEGLTYNLGMFLAHECLHTELFIGEDKTSKLGVELWFNASSDHLYIWKPMYGLQIPKKFPVQLQARLLRFKRKCLHWGHKHATVDDYYWATKEARALLIAIDKHLGVSVKRGEWE